MAVTKTARYEVLKRDNHTCRYCGAKAPGATLTVDHVIPSSLGGSDKPSNLVAACRDCNAGKGASNPDSDLVAAVSAEAAMYVLEMAGKFDAITERLANDGQMIHLFDMTWDENAGVLPPDYRESIRRFSRMGVPPELIEYAIEVAMAAERVYPRSKFKYMCGVIYRMIDEVDSAVVSK